MVLPNICFVPCLPLVIVAQCVEVKQHKHLTYVNPSKVHILDVNHNVCVTACLYCLVFYSKIVDRIDSNVDGYITTAELKSWIKRVQKRYVYENVAKVWTDYDLNKDNKISWEEYKQATYGYYLGMYAISLFDIQYSIQVAIQKCDRNLSLFPS